MSKFLSFNEALPVARSLGLARSREWQAWCKEGMCPPNVPAHQEKAYTGGGWRGWGHWLGPGNQANQTRRFLPFAEALAFARSLGLASLKEWKAWCREGTRPPNVPSNPDATYRDGGWRGWVHWLGSSDLKPLPPLPFGEALAEARSVGLTSSTEWKAWCKGGACPRNVPRAPDRAYKNDGWQGWGHWLGAGTAAGSRYAARFLPFQEALVAARSLELAGKTKWKAWCRDGMCPPNVPSNPSRTYRDHGWQGWGHWLGTGNTKTKNFLPFNEALAAAQSLGLANSQSWRAWCKAGLCPRSVPSHPERAYKNGGWQDWGHWLGTGNQQPQAKSKTFLPFDQALGVARSLRLAGQREWLAWCKSGARPANVPARPDHTYVHDGWVGYEHWLRETHPGTAAKPAPARTTRKRAAAAGHAGAASGPGCGKRRQR